ncbi:multiple epidermal growth factor-like domains protein 10, partial [Cotesia glomerata]|uniref:multiple epidermal growth factor-like domains protein 10 n=1 Tax=Cotesia glomerata TaxID=32391 RepID=UPI001D004178
SAGSGLYHCNDEIDCGVLWHSKCFQNKCVCNAKHIAVNALTCLPTLGGTCWKDDQCMTEKTHCVDFKCQCKPGFVSVAVNMCVANLINSDCAAVKFAVCSKNKCACPIGLLSVNATTCGKAFADLGMTCFHESNCNLIKNAQCFENQCSCMDNHIEMNAFTCTPLLNATCSDDLVCAPKNSACVDHKCQCEFSYFPKCNYESVLGYLELPCRIDEDCISILYAKCSDAGKCICHKNYVITGTTTCSPTLGGNCSSNRGCATVNAECSRNQCRCSPGYTQHSDDLCFSVFLGQKCDIDEDCDEISNAECSHKRCQCKEGYKKFNRKVCLPLIGTRCIEHKECAVYNSNCVENTCQCLDTFVPQTQFECVATGINVSCLTDSDCKLINTHCSKLKFCVCDQHYISMDNMTCVSILGGYCSENVTCTSPNSECIDNKCQCSPNYTPGPYNQCYPNLLGTSCQADYDCQYIPNAICIDKICVCKPNTFALTPSACTHLLNTSCSSSADCDVEASHCFENKCQCKPEWVALTDMTCVEHSAVYDCKEDFECGETWRTRCHQNKCVCNANHIAVSELTCLPILDGTCWRDDQCMTKNSHCDGSWCQCKPGFVSVAKNMCVLS